MKIQVINENNDLPLSKRKLTEITNWLCQKIELPIVSLGIVFTDDDSLRNLHKDFLNDADYTDVMTFNLGTNKAIEGEIYISNERAIDNASIYNVSQVTEICRLIVHGCLHLAGYDDKTDHDQKIMKKKEEDFLSLVLTKFLN